MSLKQLLTKLERSYKERPCPECGQHIAPEVIVVAPGEPDPPPPQVCGTCGKSRDRITIRAPATT